jgi:hypothetical protein
MRFCFIYLILYEIIVLYSYPATIHPCFIESPVLLAAHAEFGSSTGGAASSSAGGMLSEDVAPIYTRGVLEFLMLAHLEGRGEGQQASTMVRRGEWQQACTQGQSRTEESRGA